MTKLCLRPEDVAPILGKSPKNIGRDIFEGWVPIATDIFYNGVFNGGSCKRYCTVLNTVVTHNDSASFFEINLDPRDVRAYTRINIAGTFYAYDSSKREGELKIYNASGIITTTIGGIDSGGTTTTLSMDITQTTAFQSDAYLQIGLLISGASGGCTVPADIRGGSAGAR